jgi:hypothetical protein
VGRRLVTNDTFLNPKRAVIKSFMFTSSSFHPLHERDAASEGRKGGRSKSAAKTKAARENAAHGGRLRTRTLGEFLLRQKFDTNEQYNALREAVFRLTTREQKFFREYFGIPEHYLDLTIKDFISHKRKPGAEMGHIIKKFRLEARWLLSSLRPAKPTPPKDYVVIRVQRHPSERDAWERRYPDMPFVETRPEKLYIRSIPMYAYFNSMFPRNPRLTAKDIQDLAGAQMTREMAEALLKYLQSTHTPSS